MSDESTLIEVKIGALIMDPNTNTPIVVLKGVNSETVLPIWVGAFEANAIALEIEKIVPQRPMTHDLLRNLIVECGLLASRVIAGDTAVTKKYLGFLSAGGSKYPIDLLAEAGVDMTTDQPLDQTMKTMNRIMDEIDTLLAGSQ